MSPPESPPAATVDARRRRVWTVVGAAIVVVAAVLIGWWTLRNESQRITATTIGYKVESDTSVSVSFDVSRPPGLADIVVPPEGERVVHLEKAVRTTTRAVTGVVQDCVRT